MPGGPACAAFTNPVAFDSIPVNRLPDEVLGRPRSELQSLPLTLLRQREPDEYTLDKGDVLGIVAEQIIGPTGANAGQNYPVQLNPSQTSQRSAVIGYPVPVQEDGTIILPQLPPIPVKGKTLTQVRELIIAMITGSPLKGEAAPPPGSRQIVVLGTERVLVDLYQARRYQIQVVREDTSGGQPSFSQVGVQGTSRKVAGYTIYLEAFKNDLLRALNATGGPPGLDAKNEVVIRRGQYDPAEPNKGYVRIPLRARPDEPILFAEKDIILKDGDTVYIEARDTEVYYTGGLLGGAQIPLPRDYDLRITDAIAQIRGPLLNGGFSQTAFVATSTNSGIGNPNPTLVVVMRRTTNNKFIPIRVELNRAVRDLRENILILPGDTIYLQERPGEALVRYLTQRISITTNFTPIRTSNVQQTVGTTFP